MPIVIEGKPPTTGEGYVVWPAPALPGYQITSISEYLRTVDSQPNARRERSGIDATIERACVMSRTPDALVYVIRD